MSTHASLSSLPVEVVVDNLLVFLSLLDLSALGATNHYFYALCNDDVFWKRKLIEDFNYPLAMNARTSGYKFLYKGMNQPKVYVWGSVDNGRLGLAAPEINKYANRMYAGVPYPVELEFFSRKGIRIVQLSAGGWSFHALDSNGTLWAWGQMDAESFAFQGDPFTHPARRAAVPHQLLITAKFRSISSGRNHSSALDSRSSVWTFRSWGRPYRLSSPLLSHSQVVQISCGWDFSAALTELGDVYVWWPGHGEFARLSSDEDARGGRQREQGDERSEVIRAQPWEMTAAPLELPGLGSLPDPRGQTATEALKIVRVACGQDFVIALTNANQVLKIELGGGAAEDGFDTLRQSFRHGRGWDYLPLFSEAKRVAMLPAFASGSKPVPDDMRITHVSANFNTFVAYSTGSSSIVLMGDSSTQSDMAPKILPALQHRNVISVVLGDYHRAALTAQGELLTWGSFSSGALGLGDPYTLEPGKPGGFADARARDHAKRIRQMPPDVEEPTPVSFHFADGKTTPTFCFSAVASGWHVGALVMDLEEEKRTEPPLVHVGQSSHVEGEEHDDAGPSMPGSFTHAAGNSSARVEQHNTGAGTFQPEEPDLTRAMGLYGIRIGYAARGAILRGGHRGSRGRGN